MRTGRGSSSRFPVSVGVCFRKHTGAAGTFSSRSDRPARICRSRRKRFCITPPDKRVIHRQKAHADVVRHVTAHQRKALSCIFAVHKIDRFVKAKTSHSAHFPQFFQIFKRRFGGYRQTEKRRIRRNHKLVSFRFAQSEQRHAVRLILIVLLFVKPIIAAFGNAERDMLFGGELPLTTHAVLQRFKAKRIFAAFQKKIGHEKFKHRPRPRERAGVAARARHHPARAHPSAFLALAARRRRNSSSSAIRSSKGHSVRR